MADATQLASNSNPMLGSQLVGKSILNPTATTEKSQNGFPEKVEAKQQSSNEGTTTTTTNSKIPQKQIDKASQPNKTSQQQIATNNSKQQQQQQQQITGQRNTNQDTNLSKNNNNNIVVVTETKQQLKNLLCHKQEAQVQQVNHDEPLDGACETSNITTNTANSSSSSSSSALKKLPSSKDHELLSKEAQEFKIKTRKLQLEIEEKNEIINVLKDELEATKDLSDKFQRENLQLIKDSKRVKFLQDENDFLQDKVGSVDKLELEIKRLKEKLNEVDFLKLRIKELEEDKSRARDESALFEDKWKQSELKLTRISELEIELSKWKSFSHDLESEKNAIQNKLLESIEQEAKLNTINKQVEDEVKRLRSLIKLYEEQRDEEQASNSLILCSNKPNDESLSSITKQNNFCDIDPSGIGFVSADTSIKFELDKELEKELNEENRKLKQQLIDQENQISKLLETNKEINLELESNKKLISELRQDFACEKSLTSKLTNQLTSFTKQIKNLDKQYFPMHEVTSLSTNNQNYLSNNNIDDKEKSLESNGNTNITNNITQNSEKESSLSKSVTSIELKKNNSCQFVKDTLHSKDDDREKTNKHQANNSYAKKSDNETRQPSSTTCGSKLSALSEKQSHFDDVRTSEQNNTKVVKETKSLTEVSGDGSRGSYSSSSGSSNNSGRGIKSPSNLKGERIEVKHLSCTSSIITNKSTTVALNPTSSTALEIPDKGKDESCGKVEVTSQLFSSSSTESRLDNNDATDKPDDLVIKKLESNADRSEETVKKTANSSDNSNEELLTKRKLALYVGNNGNNNNSSSKSNYSIHVTSASPSSNARSQSPSSLIANNFGHDSGFQSINHDQTSSANPEVHATTASIKYTPNGYTTRAADSAADKKQQQDESGQLDQSMAKTTKNTWSDLSKVDCQNSSSTPTDSGEKIIKIAMSSANKTSKQGSNSVLGRTSNSNGSQKQQQISTANTCAKTPANLANVNVTTDRLKSSDIASPLLAERSKNVHNDSKVGKEEEDEEEEDEDEERDDEEEEEGEEDDGADLDDNKNRSFKPLKDRAPTPVRSRNSHNNCTNGNLNPATSAKSSNFVRNSLPSRSVNFGHSRPSAFLDRIRASVTATTTTNTSNSFNGQTRNIILTNQKEQFQPNQSLQQAQQLKQRAQDSSYDLNCMLDHQHSDRCFVLHNSGRAQQSQVVASDQHHDITPLQSSRQLNALIDPVSNEQLMMSMLQHQGHQRFLQHLRNQQVNQHSLVQHVNPELDGAELTEQQLAHLASLHQQHYYHHLQQMRQLHHLHHQHYLHLHHHRMHHKYQQQQQQSNVQQPTSGGGIPAHGISKAAPNSKTNEENLFNPQAIQKQPATMSMRQCEPIYSGGSQFYAPSVHFDQMYANVSASNNNSSNSLSEHNNATRLVSNGGSKSNSGQSENLLRSSPSCQHPPTRTSPQRLAHQLSHTYTLPQIDEVNGLPTVGCLSRSSGYQERKTQAIASEVKTHNNNLSSNVSPSSSSSSPTSSTSSNLSPSSSASSSSSLNSLSVSNTPLNRSALRHTTTDLTRRQFSVERDLTGALPMKATLSRVGSCRTSRTIDDATAHQLQMRTPVKSQQPSMRTSKILNISQQSNAQQPTLLQPQQQQQNQQQHVFNIPNNQTTAYAPPNGSRVSFNREQIVANGKLAVNLAKINLNDNDLDFSSLQMPTRINSSAGDNVIKSSPPLNCSTSGNHQHSTPDSSSSSKIQPPALGSASSTKERVKQGRSSNSNTSTTISSKGASNNSNNNNNNNNNNNKSSVWFEYGCV